MDWMFVLKLFVTLLLGTFVGCLLIELADNLLAGILVKRFGASVLKWEMM